MTAPKLNGKKRQAKATRLQHVLLDDGRSQRSLARDTAIPEVVLGEIVRGVRRASDAEKRSIAKAIGRPVKKLFPLRVS